MKRFSTFFMVGALALALTACGGAGGDQAQQPAGDQAQQPAAGGATYDAAAAEEKYKQNCAACHGQDLQGQVGPKLTDVGSRLSKDDIAGILANGKGSMPGNLVTGTDAENLAAWLAEKK